MTLRVALHGAGMIGVAHGASARALGHTVTAVASRSPGRAAETAERLGARAVTYADLPGDAELVVVCTPPQCHHDDVTRLLEAGAAVIVEKPLCRTLDEADALVALAGSHDERVLYAENLAHAPAVQQMLGLVPAVGEITHVEIRMQQGLPAWGEFTSDEWGGGALFDLGIHAVALALMIGNVAGMGRPTAVDARLRGAVDGNHRSDEHAEVTLHHGDRRLVHLVSSWQTGPGVEWDVQVAGTSGVVRLELQPEVTLEWNGTPVAVRQAARHDGGILEQLGYVGQLRSFADDLSARRRPLMSVAFGRAALEVTLAAYLSAGRGNEVALPFSGPRDLTPLELWHSA